jgi:hypothetical protein
VPGESFAWIARFWMLISKATPILTKPISRYCERGVIAAMGGSFMRRYILILAVVSLSGIGAWATAEVAMLSSSGPFELRGASVTPGQGIPAWPVLAGDKITSQKTPVTFTFTDGSLVILGTSSQAAVEMSGRTPVFRLQAGTAHYSLKSLTAVKLMALNTTVTPAALGGHYGLDSTTTAVKGVAPAPGLSTGVTTALALMGVATGGALGYAISQGVNSGSAVSGSQ